jgi:LmbE family N-acetylglucosaminyl deacetylase
LIRLNLQANGTGPLHILCLGAHSDDIEIGCGGTVLRLAEQYPDCIFHWVVFSAIGIREAEAKHAATLFVRPEKLRPPLEDFPGWIYAVCRCRSEIGF